MEFLTALQIVSNSSRNSFYSLELDFRGFQAGYHNDTERRVRVALLIFSRVLRDSTPRFVGPSVHRSVRPSHFTFFGFFGIFGFTAPAQMMW